MCRIFQWLAIAHLKSVSVFVILECFSCSQFHISHMTNTHDHYNTMYHCMSSMSRSNWVMVLGFYDNSLKSCNIFFDFHWILDLTHFLLNVVFLKGNLRQYINCTMHLINTCCDFIFILDHRSAQQSSQFIVWFQLQSIVQASGVESWK